MRKLFVTTVSAIWLTGGVALYVDRAEAAPWLVGLHSAVPVSEIENVQFRFGGHSYCWYPMGWQGPGWYWCGYARRRGLGWGGSYGWQGWSSPGHRPDANLRSSSNPRAILPAGSPRGSLGGDRKDGGAGSGAGINQAHGARAGHAAPSGSGGGPVGGGINQPGGDASGGHGAPEGASDGRGAPGGSGGGPVGDGINQPGGGAPGAAGSHGGKGGGGQGGDGAGAGGHGGGPGGEH